MPRISGKMKRDLEAMGRVRPELMRVVYSRLTDEEAAVRIGEIVRSDCRAAEATLRYVRRAHNFSRGYDTDRACRILVGAMNGTEPEPVGPEDAELFERERELGGCRSARRLSDCDQPHLSLKRSGLAPSNWQLLRSPLGLAKTRRGTGL